MGMKAYPIFIFRYKRVTSRPRSRSGAPTLSHPFFTKEEYNQTIFLFYKEQGRKKQPTERGHIVYTL